MSSKSFEEFYRQLFADLQISREESGEIKRRFEDENPPPDKLVWLRSSAFRIGSEFLSQESDANVALLRSINAIVHALELTCMSPKSENEDNDDKCNFDEGNVENLYREVYADLSVDRDESQHLFDFFSDLKPSPAKLVWTRSTAFRIGTEFLTDDKENNVSLLKSINAVVNALERTCMEPKPYKLKINPPESIHIESVGLQESISKAAQYLWDLDVNRLTPGQDYVINVQDGKKPYWKEDKADDPLFTMVDEKVFSRPTYKTFIMLLDNYSAETGITECVTNAERKENWDFLRAIMQTGPMQFCHKYCVANNSDISADTNEFTKLLYKIWFHMYSRDRNGEGNDSSGFEHVFVGEIKNAKVSGFHNWIYYYLEEKKGNVDYRGYIKPRTKQDVDNNDHILTLQFLWNGVEKSVGSSFIGVSPEFEMALYTMCFLVGMENNQIDLDVAKLNCKVYRFGGNKLSTSYVEVIENHD